jgi:hypothetical protein
LQGWVDKNFDRDLERAANEGSLQRAREMGAVG